MIFIALGANLPSLHGEPEETLRAAVKVLNGRGIRAVKSSRIWLTKPVPASDQPLYRNAVVAAESRLEPRAVLSILKETERAFGRIDATRNAARVLDLDLLAMGDLVMNDSDFILPHMGMERRAFVLLPFAEVAPDWRHPVTGRTVRDMAASLPGDDGAVPLDYGAL